MNRKFPDKQHPIRILHCEDDQGHAFLIGKLLEKQSPRIQVFHAGDGREGLEFLQTTPQLPDLILLDLRMPRMGGMEMLGELQNHPIYQSIPVVILTTSYAEYDLYGASGRDSYKILVKPLEYQALAEQIHTVCSDFCIAETKATL